MSLISKASVWLLIWVLRDLWMRSSAAMIEHVFLVCVVAGPAVRFGHHWAGLSELGMY